MTGVRRVLFRSVFFFFFFNDTATTEIYTLSLHDALPILIIPDVQITLRLSKVREDLGIGPFVIAKC